MKINRLLSLALVGVTATAVVVSSSAQAAPKALKDVKIAAVVKGLDNPYFIGVKNGIVDTAKALGDRKSTRLNSSHSQQSRMPSSA